MSAGSRPDETLDLRVFFDKAELESVGAVIDDNNIFKILTDQGYHFFLAVIQLQIVIACVPVIALIESVVVSRRSVSCAVLVCAVDDRLDIVGKVCSFSAGSGDHDHGCAGERLCVSHHIG